MKENPGQYAKENPCQDSYENSCLNSEENTFKGLEKNPHQDSEEYPCHDSEENLCQNSEDEWIHKRIRVKFLESRLVRNLDFHQNPEDYLFHNPTIFVGSISFQTSQPNKIVCTFLLIFLYFEFFVRVSLLFNPL